MIVVESSYMANNGNKSKKPAPVVAPRHARLVKALIKAAKSAGREEDGYPANAENAAAALKRAELRLLEALAEQYELVGRLGHELDVRRGDLEPCDEGGDCQTCSEELGG